MGTLKESWVRPSCYSCRHAVMKMVEGHTLHQPDHLHMIKCRKGHLKHEICTIDYPGPLGRGCPDWEPAPWLAEIMRERPVRIIREERP